MRSTRTGRASQLVHLVAEQGKRDALAVRLSSHQRLREMRGLTIVALAAKAQIARGTLHRLESSPMAVPTLDTLLRLQRALELPSLELLLEGQVESPSRRLLAEEERS